MEPGGEKERDLDNKNDLNQEQATHRVTSPSNSTFVCLSSLFLCSGPEANYFLKFLDNSR